MSAAAPLARPRRWSGMLAWALWALTMLGLAVLVWLDQLLRQAARPELVALTPTAIPPVLGAVSTATVGAVLASRRARHPVGWLLEAFGLSLSAAGVALAYTNYGVAHPRASRRPGRLVCARHHRHGDLLQRLRPAAHPDWGAAVAPLALVGGGHRGHTGRLAAGRDARTQAR